MEKQILLFLALSFGIFLSSAQDTCKYLVWADEFAVAGAPDTQKWGYDTGDHGWGNNELQNYTNTRTNSYVENGKLVIKALKTNDKWSSARLVSKGKGDWLYGRIEVSAKLPFGKGTWPAIWMLPTDWTYGGWPASGEIDIMEHVGYELGKVHGTIHTEAFNHSIGTQLGASVDVLNVNSVFHVYAIEWNENEIVWFVDNKEYYRVSNPKKTFREWPFDKRFHLLLNIAIGGNWGGAQGIDPNLNEATMEIDYVRVYQKTPPKISVTGKKNALQNEELIFSVPSMPGTQVKWFYPNDVLPVSGQNSASVLLKWGKTSGNVFARIYSACDTLVSDTVFVNVQTSPTGSLLQIPLFDTQGKALWKTLPGTGNTIAFSGNPNLQVAYSISNKSENPQIYYEFSGTTDLSVLKKMEITLKASDPVPGSFRIDLEDAAGNVNIQDIFKIADFKTDGQFGTFSYEFGQNANGIFNLKQVKKIRIFINYGIFGKTGDGQIEISSIKLVNPTATAVVNVFPGNGISVWPNPFTDVLNFRLPSYAEKFLITNLAGQMVISGLPDGKTGSLDLTTLLPGTYFLSIISRNSSSRPVQILKLQK